MYETLEQMVVEAAATARPPERLTVSEAAEKYRYLNNIGSYVGPWRNKFTPYMVEPMDVSASEQFVGEVFVGPAQSGKALALDTPLATPSGWTTMGGVRVGDMIFAEDGSATRVTFATEVMYGHDCYRVTFDDGSSIIADADHKWKVWNPDRGPKEDNRDHRFVTTTQDMATKVRRGTKRGSRAMYAIDLARELLTPHAMLPVDPYVLGVFLGDGARHTVRVCCGEADLQELLRNVQLRGYSATVTMNANRAPDMSLRDQDGRSLYSQIKKLGLQGAREKRIPEIYLRASVTQRRELLRGLMDTDGWAQKGKRACVFTTTEPGLARTVSELLRSLGHKVRVKTKTPTYRYAGERKAGALAYSVCFSSNNHTDVFSFGRKVLIGKKVNLFGGDRSGQTKRHFVRSIERVPSVPVRCIQVDHESHMFLAGESMVPTHNTDALLMNKIVHSSICEPNDLMIVQTSKATARDFSIRRVARLFRHSPEVANTILPGRGNDNVFDVKFKSGSLLTLSWPAINELSGKPIPIVMLTDYDRMPEDVDGEGSPFDLSRKRTTTFGRFAMTIAESSPGFENENPRWIPQSRHEAPPTKGILALYNRGDRRRWYWQCVSCKNGFEPDFKLLVYPSSRDHVEAAEAATLACPHCGQVYHHETRRGVPGKDEMNVEHARWLKDGELWKPTGIEGVAVRSQIASFWLKGVCAHFTTWRHLVLTYLQAQTEFERTGSEEALKTTVNTDQGDVYTPVAARMDRLPEVLMGRAIELPEKVVPEGVRFLVASVDVQKNRFEVQVHGIGVDAEMFIVDRFSIRKSARTDDDGEHLWMNPASYLEDWDMLIEHVIEKTYPIDDDSGREMAIFHTICDSGGREGVTANAYNFWRRLRDDEQARGHHGRFSLLKGAPGPRAPRVARSYPDSDRKDRRAGARGEVPVLLINTNMIKDQAAAILDRTEPGGVRITFPKWLPESFYNELTVEIRGPKGWENPKKLRNEAWDLLVYCLAACLAAPINIEHLDWTNPPGWANDWDDNVLIRAPEAVPIYQPVKKDDRKTLRDLAAKLA